MLMRYVSFIQCACTMKTKMQIAKIENEVKISTLRPVTRPNICRCKVLFLYAIASNPSTSDEVSEF